jgi:hypothetical protein
MSLESRECGRRQLEEITGIPLTLEGIISAPDCFGLTTMTPLQRAVCRAVQGLPIGELWHDTRPYTESLAPPNRGYYFDTVVGDPDLTEYTKDRSVAGVVRAAFRGVLPEPGEQPLEVALVAGIRTFKSMVAAALSIISSQTVDLSPTLEAGGEIPRYSVLSLEIDNARDVHRHVVAALQRPRMAHLRVTEREIRRLRNDPQYERWYELLRESRSYTVGSTFVRHPTGRIVEIRVVAGKRAGGSLVSKWSVGCTLDEAPRMVGASEGVINLEDARRAVIARLLPGGQLFMPGSPWAPFGPVYEMVENDFGHPTRGRLVIVCPGPALNPYWWTPEQCTKIRGSDPTTFKTDGLARFADAEEQLFPVELIESCCRPTEDAIPYEAGHDYAAAADPATRGNAWTFVIADKVANKKRVVFATEWRGSSMRPLSPREVLREIGRHLRSYRLEWAYTDEWAADALRDIAGEEGFTLVDEPMRMHEQIRKYLGLAAEMADGQVELPNNTLLKKDFKFVRKRPTQKGATIALLHTPDGRHADFAPATMRCLGRWINDVETEIPPFGTPERARWDDEQRAEAELDKQRAEMAEEWWERDAEA